MSKILLLSDSHRDDETLEKILEKHKDVDLKIHAGDSCYEAYDKHLEETLVVLGNHDFGMFPEYIVRPPFFICHGHTFNVYTHFDEMIKLAKHYQCTTIIHGHTHIPYDEICDGIRIINPGSVLINRGDYGYGTYAIIDTDTDKLTFYHHTTHEDVTDVVLEDGRRTLANFRSMLNGFN